jgi:hypothetical protein
VGFADVRVALCVVPQRVRYHSSILHLHTFLSVGFPTCMRTR